MNSKVMNKVLSFLLVAAVAFTTIFTPVNAATVNSRDKKLKGKIKEMHVYDGLTEIANKDTIQMAVGATKTLTIEFVDKSEKKAATHQVVAKSNNKKAVAATADYDKDLNESVVTLAVDATAKAGDKATVTIKSKAKKVKTVKFNVEVIEMVPVTGVTLDNTAPKIGQTINAKLVPENADATGLTYKWEALTDAAATTGEVILGATTSSFTVSEAEFTKFIRVTVTDAAGKTYSATTTTAVIKDNTVNVYVTDDSGLQADGTGKTTDVLRLSYGSALGVPAEITWYRDDVVVAAGSDKGGTIGKMLAIGPGTDYTSATNLAGSYYVVIKDQAGTTYTSNKLTLTKVEGEAEISNFTITDDLTTKENVTIDPDDAKAVVSVTINKDYTGTFYLYQNDVQKYKIGNAAGSKRVTASADADTNVKSGLTAKKCIEDTDHTLKYKDDETGEVTYMFQISESLLTGTSFKALERGESYKLAFSQDDVESTVIDNNAKSTIKTTEAVKVPYLPAPASLNVKSVASNTNAVVEILGADGKKMEWLGVDDLATASGFATFTVYESTSMLESDAVARDNTSGKIKEGTYTGETKMSAGMKFFYAQAKTTAGIFDKTSATIKSAFKSESQAIATKVGIEEDATDATKANITLETVVGPATAYLYKTSQTFDKDDKSTYVAKATIAKGDGKASFENAFSRKDFGESYLVKVVPDDDSTFTTFTMATKDAFTLKHVATTMTVDGSKLTVSDVAASPDAKITGTNAPNLTNLVAYDQFGDKIETPDADVSDKVAKVTVVNNNAAATEAAKAKFNVTNGVVDFTVTPDATNGGVDLKDGYTIEVLGTKFEFRAKQASTLGNAPGHANIWEIKVGSKTLNDGVVATTMKFKNTTEFANALSVVPAPTSGGPTYRIIADDDAIIISGDYTIPSNASVENTTANGVTFSGTITNNGALVAAGTKALAFTGDVINNKTLTSGAAADMTFGGTLTVNKGASDPTAVTMLNNSSLYYLAEPAGTVADSVYTLATSAAVSVGYDADHMATITKGAPASATAVTAVAYDASTVPVPGQVGVDSKTIKGFTIGYSSGKWTINLTNN